GMELRISRRNGALRRLCPERPQTAGHWRGRPRGARGYFRRVRICAHRSQSSAALCDECSQAHLSLARRLTPRVPDERDDSAGRQRVLERLAGTPDREATRTISAVQHDQRYRAVIHVLECHAFETLDAAG